MFTIFKVASENLKFPWISRGIKDVDKSIVHIWRSLSDPILNYLLRQFMMLLKHFKLIRTLKNMSSNSNYTHISHAHCNL